MTDKNKFKANPYNLSNKLIEKNDIDDIMNKLNITDFLPKDIKLYQKAFVHKSYSHMKDYEEYSNDIKALPLQENTYEKMEFLGDSILGYIVCEYIFKRYTMIYDRDEGFLTKLKNRLVCGDMLCNLADELNFNKYLIISKHIEENCDGRNNKNILEDSFEAFIGALYLDTQNIDFVKEFLIKVYEEYVDFSEIILNDTNYKDQLQRYLQNTFKEYPKYVVEEYNKIYKCKIYKGKEYISEGIGETKKKAEQDASKNTLIYYGVLN
jgi:ribonuclease-3